MPRAEWDVIVIGAGLGGLLSASILARSGHRVLLLERENQVGGRLRSEEVDGFVIDAGAYLWPNAHLDDALSAAGVTDFRASPIPPGRVMRMFVQGGRGRSLAFPWPGLPESPDLLVTAEAALLADARVFRGVTELWQCFAEMPEEEVESLRYVTVGEALPRFARDPRVAEAFVRNIMLFGTYTPEAASMAQCIRMRRRNVARSARPECAGANPLGGVRALPRAIAQVLADHGGEIRLGWSVDLIIIEDGRACGVYAHGPTPFRERFDSSVVVSNLPIWQLFGIVREDVFPSAFVESARRYEAVGGTVGAAFAFRARPRLRQTGEEDDFPGWTRLLIGPGRGFGGGMLWSSLHSPHNAPPGRHVLQAMRLSPHTDLVDARRVGRILDDFRAMLDEIYLDAQDKLLWARTWTTHDGSEYMVSAAPKPPVAAPGVRDLYFVGETTDVPAIQMDAAALSALRAAEMISGGGS
jgi:phytoene dehydrogenase-like protein